MPPARPVAPPIEYIPRITAQYAGLGYAAYQWIQNSTAPAWTSLTRPMSRSRLGLIATGGIYVEGQTAFHFKDDTSYRAIPTDVDSQRLRATHFAYDLTDARSDINVVFPIDTLRDLVAEGVVGALGEHAYTIMGGIYSARRVSEELVPGLVRRCREDELDAVLLVPV